MSRSAKNTSIKEILRKDFESVKKLPIKKLQVYTEKLVKEANRKRKIILNSKSMENNPLRSYMEKHGDYKIEGKKRQNYEKAFTDAYSLLTIKHSTVNGWESMRKESRQRFIERFTIEPDSDTGDLDETAEKMNKRLKRISYKDINKFWDLFSKAEEDKEIANLVAGLDTNALAQSIYDVWEEIRDRDNIFTKLREKLVGKDGLLTKRYKELQDERNDYDE